MNTDLEALIVEIKGRLSKIKQIEEYEIFVQNARIQNIVIEGKPSEKTTNIEGLALRVITKERKMGFFTASFSQIPSLMAHFTERLGNLSFVEERTFLDLKKNRVSVPKISEAMTERIREEAMEGEITDVNLHQAIHFIEEKKSISNSSSGDLIVSEQNRAIVNHLTYTFPAIKFRWSSNTQITSGSKLEIQKRSFLTEVKSKEETRFTKLKEKTIVVLTPNVLGKLLIEITDLIRKNPSMISPFLDEDLSIFDDPFHPFSFTSSTIDDEGLRTQPRWFYDSTVSIPRERSIDPRYIQHGGNGFKISPYEFWPRLYSIPPTGHFTNLFLKGGWNRREFILGEKEYVLIDDADIQLDLNQRVPSVTIQIKQGTKYSKSRSSEGLYGGSLQTDLRTILLCENLTKEAIGILHYSNMITTFTGYAAIPPDRLELLP
ncbi:MAG: hypothetical protein D6732_27915 [Methanobacteriota archaeon]|nr:MAG: hypothetical protein D6732_27915 [Euryarchaeota archaeon]